MKIRFTGLLLLISLFLLSACGQKGPLYLEKAATPKAETGKVEKNATTEQTEKTENAVKSEKKD